MYHSLLTRGQALDLEKLQNQALKICFGFELGSDEIRRAQGVQTMKERRGKIIDKFITKAAASPRFGLSWFP